MTSIKKPRLNRIVDLQKFFIAFRDIERVIHLKSVRGHEKENDIEHSYTLAMTGWFIAQSFPDLDRNKIIIYALVHDIVEVYAGDTFAFAEKKEIDKKKIREADALQRIKKEWQDFPEMVDTIEQYETMSDDESRFVYALDKIMPTLLNIISDGHTWRTENISLHQPHRIKKDKVIASPEISQYYDEIYALLKVNQAWFPKS
jgi:5'-deoxynucleotidase YfbR-like HD superfamily hydrolase